MVVLNKFRRYVITIILFLTIISTAQARYGGGSGTENNPYQIWTAEQMNAIGAYPGDWNKHFKLMADIDMSGFDGRTGRPAFNLIGPDPDPETWYYDPYAFGFSGVFDGNGHTISHLTIAGQSYLGLFCYLDYGGEVRNLGVLDVDISGLGRMGGTGALAGYTFGSLVTNCYSTGVVSSTGTPVGGLIGYNRGQVTCCFSEARIQGTSYSVGGLVGENWGHVTDCYSMGSVGGTGTWVGGLVGSNYGSVDKCYSNGTVSGRQDIGGLVGGGGGRGSGVTNSFWDTQTSRHTASSGGTGKTTALMKTASTFLSAEWDFVDETDNGTEDIWWIYEGNDYPHLVWELSGIMPAPGADITKPGDIIIGFPNDGDWPSNEAPQFAIDDNITTKYLHRKGDFVPDPGTGGTGFRVTPSITQTIVVGLTFTTANDWPGRDPIAFELSGSNESIDGPYILIVSGEIIDFKMKEWPRRKKNETPISFQNNIAYDHYQLIFTAIRGPASGMVRSMQIAEVELLGAVLHSSAPYLPDGSVYAGTFIKLRWTRGVTAASHNVYFGDNLADVEAGTGSTFCGNQDETYFSVGLPGCPYPDGLVLGTTYYWRVDEVESDDLTIHTGNIWSFTVVDSVTVECQVSVSEDDAYAYGNALQNSGNDYLRVGYSSFNSLPYYMSGMVFRNVDIPQGAEILSATLRVHSYDSRLTDAVCGKIEAEATDNSAALGGSRYIDSVVKTSASVTWDHYEPWTANTWYESPDISAVVQEVIHRAGWLANNSLTIIYGARQDDGGVRHFSSYDRAGEYAPKLEITYAP